MTCRVGDAGDARGQGVGPQLVLPHGLLPLELELRERPLIAAAVDGVQPFKTYIHDYTCPVLEESIDRMRARVAVSE